MGGSIIRSGPRQERASQSEFLTGEPGLSNPSSGDKEPLIAYEIEGINPSHSFGDEITFNVFHRPPIVDYCRTVAPDIMDKVPDWLFNDGQGLQHQDAVELGRLLLASLPLKFRQHFSTRQQVSAKVVDVGQGVRPACESTAWRSIFPLGQRRRCGEVVPGQLTDAFPQRVPVVRKVA